ncbi:MAG: ATP-binding protein [bacterium]
MRAAEPAHERERLETLRRYRILDTPKEMSYDDLTLLASEICGTPIAAISLVDEDRQWFKSILGLEVQQTSRDVAFCAHAIRTQDEQLIVEDATLDARFADNALVTGQPGIRFYAGTPLVMADGNAIGTLCVIDKIPRTITDEQRRALGVLGRQVVAQLELRRNLILMERSVRALARTESDLRRTQREQLELKDQFVSHVSHELRSPLTPIYQFVTILLDEIGGPLTKEQREYLGIVLRNTDQLRQMIGDLVDLTRTQAGKLTVDRRRIRVEEIAADLVRSLGVTAKANSLTLSSEVSADLPEVVGDATRVRQILSNLIENAIKFTPEGGSITVQVCVRPEEPGAVRVTVSDTGCGLFATDCRRVFEQHYQAKCETQRSRNGLGLGLYIAKELVQRQDGRIWVESEKGKGSRFSFTLPVFALESLLTPLLTAENLAHGTYAVITVDLVPAGSATPAADPKPAMDAAWEAVSVSVHPAMDVLLPRLGNAERGETFVIIAMANEDGVNRIVRRIENRLSRCELLRGAGYEARVAPSILTLPGSSSAANRDGVAAEIVRTLDGHVDELCREGAV